VFAACLIKMNSKNTKRIVICLKNNQENNSMKTKLLGGMIAAIMILTACTTNQVTTPDANAASTMVAQTLAVIVQTMAQAQQATPVLLPTTSPTQPLIPTLTFTPSPQPTATLPPTSTASPTANLANCYKAAYVADVTVPDRTPFSAGTSFTKTWRLSNVGTCTWDSGYKVVFISGDAMSAPASVALNKTVAPGATVDISVTMVAPSGVREYAGYWMLQSSNGTLFGIGADGKGMFYVDIKVVGGTSTVTPTPGTGTPTATLSYLAVRSVSITASPATFTGVCPTTISVTGTLTANRAGTVKYHFVRSDGSISSTYTLTFTAGGSLAISDSFSASTTGYDTVYVDEPNHQLFGSADYIITCGTATATSTTAPTSTPTSTDTPTPTPTDTETPTPTST
jgi:hypothetical protein